MFCVPDRGRLAVISRRIESVSRIFPSECSPPGSGTHRYIQETGHKGSSDMKHMKVLAMVY